MPRPKNLKPTYCLRKDTFKAYVVIDGQHHQLPGSYGSQESRDAYDRLVGEWIARSRRPAVLPSTQVDAITVSIVLDRFWSHASSYYPPGRAGRGGGELESYRLAMRPLRRLYGATPAAKFGPLALKAVRQSMIDELKWCRTYINRQVLRLKHVFRWSVEHELVPANVYHALQAVAGIRAGKSTAPESGPVKPVAIADVDAVLLKVSAPIAAMIRLQLYTGARPGEICMMRTRDIDRSGSVWVYRPESHKTQHHGHDREIRLGPKAQAALAPFLKFDQEAYLFSPAEAEAQRNSERRLARQTPMTPSQTLRTEIASRRARQRAPRACYDVASYRRAIARACDEAFPPPEDLRRQAGESRAAFRARLTPEQRRELSAWQAAHRWHPHQLRHNAATNIRREHGIEAARIILGHKTLAVTGIYAEADGRKADAIIAAIG